MRLVKGELIYSVRHNTFNLRDTVATEPKNTRVINNRFVLDSAWDP